MSSKIFFAENIYFWLIDSLTGILETKTNDEKNYNVRCFINRGLIGDCIK